MTTDQYTELIEFLGRKFEAIEHRLAVLEVGQEAMRDDIRALAEGQAVINARLDRLEARVEGLEARMGRFEAATLARFDGIEARMGRFEAATLARFDGIETRVGRFEAATLARFDGIETRFDRFEVDFGTVVLDHGRRLEALEGSGGS